MFLTKISANYYTFNVEPQKKNGLWFFQIHSITNVALHCKLKKINLDFSTLKHTFKVDISF